MDPIKVSQNSVLHVKSSFFQIISVNFKAGLGEGAILKYVKLDGSNQGLPEFSTACEIFFLSDNQCQF
jgi:hypothetical protein